MNISRKALCVVYGVVGVLALIGTWGNNVQYSSLGFLGANLRFWQETLVNQASRSITVDLFFLAFAATVWMVLEARRLSMKWVWLYVLFGLLVAVSFTFPVFMIHRERVLAARDGSLEGGTLTGPDVIGLGVLLAGMVAYSIIALGR